MKNFCEKTNCSRNQGYMKTRFHALCFVNEMLYYGNISFNPMQINIDESLYYGRIFNLIQINTNEVFYYGRIFESYAD